jgi:hypothetical protein
MILGKSVSLLVFGHMNTELWDSVYKPVNNTISDEINVSKHFSIFVVLYNITSWSFNSGINGIR